MRILAIETSCDETALAIAEFSGTRAHPRLKILSHMIASQTTIHAQFGGVVPNLARREHQKNLPILLKKVLQETRFLKYESGIMNSGKQKGWGSRFVLFDSILTREEKLALWFKKEGVKIAPPDIDAIAVTNGPGLAPALWVGVNFAKTLAYLWDKPLMPINHMAGHLYAAYLQKDIRNNFAFTRAGFRFPALALLVSGGHTELVLMHGHGEFQIIGATRDDAAGEAFDKVARMLGLPYPGGPALATLADTGDPTRFPLPSPMLKSKNFDFSFSGLKTAVWYLWRDMSPKERKNDQVHIAASFQEAVIRVLVEKTLRAAKKHGVLALLLGGGVSANTQLRNTLAAQIKIKYPDVRLFLCDPLLSGDNALMIALAAFFCGKKSALEQVQADANMILEGH